jgi:replicative DNA helicase
VSVAEVMPPYSGPPYADTAPRLSDRTPPQDMEAEQCVLGAMLMSKDAIADVVEVLRSTDFYRPAHEQVYNAIIDLYGRGEPADAVTVSDELGKRGELLRIGGAPYLHTLLASVPVAANAGYYAQIVHEKAVLRRLVEASVRIGQMSYAAEGDVDDIVDRAQAEVYSVTERRLSDDYKPLSELMQPTLDEMEAIESRGAGLSGVPTGFADLDELTNGLHPGQMVIIAARPAVGKALALDTPLPTPTGWTCMGDVRVGDELLGSDGRPTTVVAATDILLNRPCFKVTFSDGTSVIADAEHQWRASSRASRRAAAERIPPRYYFDPTAIARLEELAVQAQTDESWVSMQELIGEVGAVFRNVLHSVGREVGHGVALGALPDRKGGGARSRIVYPRALMLKTLASRVSRPINSWHAFDHHDVVATAELSAAARLRDGRCNWAVPLTAALQLVDADLPLDPYALGVWLGDGHSASARFTSADPEIAEHLRSRGFAVEEQIGLNYGTGFPLQAVEPRLGPVCGTPFVPQRIDVRTCGRSCGAKVRGETKAPAPACPDCGQPYAGGRRCERCHADHGTVQAVLRSLGVLRNKHIPAKYLRASDRQRRALLAGLLDTDGTVGSNGSVQYTSTCRRLASDVFELVASLGYRANMSRKVVRGRSSASSIAYSVNFTTDDDVFWLSRKATLHRKKRAHPHPASRQHYVVSVERVESVPVRCVQVDNADHMYLVTRAMVPTHNSTLALDFARAASIRNGLTSVIFSLEMSQIEITMRLLSAEASIPLSHIRGGRMSDQDWNRVSAKMGQVSEAPLFIDDSPNLTIMEIRAKARRLKQRHDLKLVIIDYIQLMTSGKKVESRQLEVSEFSRQLKLLAKELDVPVVALSQLNRGPEQRTDKRPMLSDLRESGSLEQDADMVILLNRPDLYDRDSDRAGEADFDVAKHRNGPTKMITVAFQGHYSRFTDMQI